MNFYTFHFPDNVVLELHGADLDIKEASRWLITLAHSFQATILRRGNINCPGENYDYIVDFETPYGEEVHVGIKEHKEL